ncbi:MAG TPA: glucose 1-dehydrogenase [Acidimicrobiales bacterium]|jgi:NAD(P)-dependent dehydrogenase (short-subunit alcohol dehydrogenase family)|nr:glucose 1-dehydrogenase [Actinomycetes bacterium]MDP6106611.1 glucose 1-dehydrogenase [Acidimicrobiales bacterium]MCP4845103.1 glucose 1-dehydrogenase [Actinomycetes bacterium]MDP6240850.1 glucose 1-dehydrogenase [Acidimicrobiales bacterium]MDP7125649.1 glucose 1-dehydrogenase [Acidimicrobiales bacterium]|tara:strand:+ start:7489 stop:8238 length:750 start_codon:yes stop_codon:yes gene_type:complete
MEQRVALVTGATSGIGRACALRLAADGFAVVVGGRSAERAAEVVDEITAGGGTATTALGDVAEPDYGDAAVAATVAAHGRLDVLVNAAGVITRSDAEGTTDDEWHRIMSTNVDGLFRASRAALPAIRAAGGGTIVNISSTNGLVGAAGLAAYCASKGAVTNLTRAMALDHAAEGIRVNAVCPGAVDTRMLYSEGSGTVDEVRDRNLPDIPEGRIPDGSEVAELVAFLADDRSRHITGANISIDGGYTAR